MPPDGARRPPEDTHTCPCGCGNQVGNELFACRSGWWRLPKQIRSRLHMAWTLRRTEEHREAMGDACTWYRNNPPTRRLRSP